MNREPEEPPIRNEAEEQETSEKPEEDQSSMIASKRYEPYGQEEEIRFD